MAKQSKRLKQIKVFEGKLFEGDYNKQMPLLRKEGFKPATAEEIQKLRLQNRLSFYQYHDTATGIFCAGNNQDKLKIIPYSKNLVNITPKTECYNGGIKKTQKDYEKAKVQEFSIRDMIFNEGLTEKEALKHLGWLAVLNGNKELLEEVIGHVFREIRDRYNKKTKAMGFYLRDAKGPMPSTEIPNEYALALAGLYYGDDRADGFIRFNLGNGARLVGLGPRT